MKLQTFHSRTFEGFIYLHSFLKSLADIVLT